MIRRGVFCGKRLRRRRQHLVGLLHDLREALPIDPHIVLEASQLPMNKHRLELCRLLIARNQAPAPLAICNVLLFSLLGGLRRREYLLHALLVLIDPLEIEAVHFVELLLQRRLQCPPPQPHHSLVLAARGGVVLGRLDRQIAERRMPGRYQC
mgnify:CR=1 FL=1